MGGKKEKADEKPAEAVPKMAPAAAKPESAAPAAPTVNADAAKAATTDTAAPTDTERPKKAPKDEVEAAGKAASDTAAEAETPQSAAASADNTAEVAQKSAEEVVKQALEKLEKRKQTLEKENPAPTLQQFLEFTKKHGDKFTEALSQTEETAKKQKLAELRDGFDDEDRQLYERCVELAYRITPEQLATVKTTYGGEDGSFKPENLAAAISNGTLTLADCVAAAAVWGNEVVTGAIGGEEGMPESTQFFVDSLREAGKNTADAAAKLARITEITKKYPDAYAKFLENPESEESQHAFLKAITDTTERAAIEDALKNEPSNFEKKAVRYQSLKGGKFSREEIAALVKNGTLNFREGIVANALFDKKSEVDEAAEEGGWIAVITMLIEKIKRLVEIGTLRLEKELGGKKKEKKGDEENEDSEAAPAKLTIVPSGKTYKKKNDYESGKGVRLEHPNGEQLVAPGKGTIAVDGTTVILTLEDKRVIRYENVHPADGIAGTSVEAGAVIGAVEKDNAFALRLFNDKNEEQDPTSLLNFS